MGILKILAITFMFSACSAQPIESHHATAQQKNIPAAAEKKPVLVELFTAEGCSSCPPAEMVLAKLQREQPIENAELITLALHVDYWDEFGWRDKFASPLNTQRQRFYDQKFRTGKIYTPQMVVDGDAEFVGSNFEKAEKAISKAIKLDKADVNLSIVDDKIRILVSKVPKHETSTVYLALAEDELSSNIQRGENAGKNLTHVSVVRRLKALSRLEELQDKFQIELPIQIGKDWNRDKLNAVVFIQENKSRRVLGVARVQLNPENNSN